jgi:hypothetical protein
MVVLMSSADADTGIAECLRGMKTIEDVRKKLQLIKKEQNSVKFQYPWPA